MQASPHQIQVQLPHNIEFEQALWALRSVVASLMRRHVPGERLSKPIPAPCCSVLLRRHRIALSRIRTYLVPSIHLLGSETNHCRTRRTR